MSAELFGFNINTLDFIDAVDKANSCIESDKFAQVVTINPEMFAEAEKNEKFADVLNNAEIIVPDGIGVKIALKIIGYESDRIPGIDLAKHLMLIAAEKGWSVALIGAKEDILNKACKNLKIEMPSLNIVYSHNGYFDNDNEIYKDIKNANPQLILVAMGSPRQEFFISNAKNVITRGLMIGVGGSFDVWSGNVQRAPNIFQKTGTEWLYRTITQPERFKRIFPTLPLFLLKAIKYRFLDRSFDYVK
jgi:N-acetylglucosaminyldiphosphoundecaprenol N-acetyl-beta-D-mannosaminyltransferase